MKHPILKVAGFTMIGLALVALFLEVALAIRAGDAFYGTNYKGMPLGVTYPIVGMVIVVSVGVWLGGVRLISALKRRRRKG